MMAEYHLPSYFHERLAVETEEQKRLMPQEILARILEQQIAHRKKGT
jgi:hypothetical protein